MDEKFRKAVEVVIRHEGGYRNRPSDPGGPTKYGISQKSYPDLDIKNLSVAEATLIYKRDFWDLFGYGRIGNYPLALKVFDHDINIGWMQMQSRRSASRAHVFLQVAANEVIQAGHGTAGQLLEVDGQLGPLTIETVNALEPSLLLLRYLSLVHIHYKACAKTQPDELPGWEARLWACL